MKNEGQEQRQSRDHMEVTVSENPKKEYMILIYRRGSVTRVNRKQFIFFLFIKITALKFVSFKI